MSRIKCYMIEPTGVSRYRLRRYNLSDNRVEKCSNGNTYHNASGPIIGETQDNKDDDTICNNPPPKPKDDDPRWPVKCDHCEYVFKDEDHRQVSGDALYKNTETGDTRTLIDFDAGAMWFQNWYLHFYEPGPDGNCLMCKLPGGYDWCIDGEANNCTRPGDKTHKCWVREGVPPNVTAGKNGNTCSAGAGSIAVPGYHGFLRNGYLEG